MLSMNLFIKYDRVLNSIDILDIGVFLGILVFVIFLFVGLLDWLFLVLLFFLFWM